MQLNSTNQKLCTDVIEQKILDDAQVIRMHGLQPWDDIASKAKAELETEYVANYGPTVIGISGASTFFSFVNFAISADHTGAIDNVGEISGLIGVVLGFTGIFFAAMAPMSLFQRSKKKQRRSVKKAVKPIPLKQPVVKVDDDGVVTAKINTSIMPLTFNLGSDDQEAIARRLLNMEAMCKQVDEENSQNRLEALAQVGLTTDGRLADMHLVKQAKLNEAQAKRMKKQANEQLVRSLRNNT